MAANKISYFYDLRGPSIVYDTACSSSLVALNAAVRDLRAGTIDRAIVSGVSVTLDPAKNAVFNAYTMLSPDGICYSFDERANGYCRSEGIATIILEREDVCKTGICRILGTSVNSDGFKTRGITYPSGTQQYSNALLAFAQAGVHPDSIGYVEAHGTGTTAGDAQELAGFARVFYGPGTVPRQIPLGSVKSNMGHAEGASGLMSLIKCLVMYENQQLYPNANFVSTAHSQLLEGYFAVVQKTVAWTPSNVCISNYGFGGTNAFAILGPVQTPPVDDPISRASSTTFSNLNGIPVPMDDQWAKQQIALGNDNMYRYKNGIRQRPHRHITFLYGGQGSQWNGMGRSLYGTNPSFTATIDRLAVHLRPSVDLVELFKDGNSWLQKEKSVLGITSYQIAVTNMLEEVGIYPDAYLGHSLGEVAAGYASYGEDPATGARLRMQTEEQTIRIAQVRSTLSSMLWTDYLILQTPLEYTTYTKAHEQPSEGYY
jgi:fatty acid synthase